MSVLRYCCFRWLVYDRALVFEPSRPLACIVMLVWLIYVVELCCDIFPWVPDLDRTHLRAWLVYGQIGGVTVDLRGSIVTWPEVSWSSSLTSSLIGVGITGTDFCHEPLSNKGEGTITSSSSTFLPLTSLERIHYLQQIFCLWICDRRCTQQFPLGILWRRTSLIWVWAYQVEIFFT